MAARLSSFSLAHARHATSAHSRVHALDFLVSNPGPGPGARCQRRALMSAFSQARPPSEQRAVEPGRADAPAGPSDPTPIVVPQTNTRISSDAASPQAAGPPPSTPKPAKERPKLRSAKAAITITPTAVERLRNLLHSPTPQLIRIGVRNKGCAGLSYHLEYVDKPAKFDEVVEQDGVKVIIDSKALFSIIGSEMDWQEDVLSAKFAFKNPNIKDACGCGESFTV